jgi:hypothetical protein
MKITTIIITTTVTTARKWGTDRGKIVVLVYNKKKRRKKAEAINNIYMRINVTSNSNYRLKTSSEGSIFISKQLLAIFKNRK